MTDIDDMITDKLDSMDRVMRNLIADGLTEILDTVADETDNAWDDDKATQWADDYVTDQDVFTDDYTDHREVLLDTFRAGYDAALTALREAIEVGKYTGWRPPMPEFKPAPVVETPAA